MRMRLSDERLELVASLAGVRRTGQLASVAFTVDPDDFPVILRDVGIQEIYSIAWKVRWRIIEPVEWPREIQE